MTKKRPQISIIIPVFNGEKFLPQCLNAINRSRQSFHELIVVDDCSTDESAEISRQAGAVVYQMPHQSGPAAARNFGAAKAVGDVLMFIDVDVVIKPDAIGRIAARFDEDPELTALFGSYDDEPGERNFLSQYRNLLHHFVHQTSNPEASTFWTGLGAVRRRAFLEQGGFDTAQFPLPSIEDIEFGRRLRASGRRITLDRDIQGKHLKRWDAVSVLRTDIFQRAWPWSKLLLTSRQKILNDMNLKTNDRLSSALVLSSTGILPISCFLPEILLLFGVLLILFALLNRRLLNFLYRKKGISFTAAAFPWLWLYFFYSGLTFFVCWLRYGLSSGRRA